MKVAIIDTSLMCCWLEVPGRDTAGSEPDLWDHARACGEIDAALEDGCQLVFPITTLVEAGNHAAHAPYDRRDAAMRLAQKLDEALAGRRPWTSFTEQFSTIGEEALARVCTDWPDLAARKVSIGDHLITAVADYYGLGGFDVRILSSDALLRSHVAARPPRRPRRRGG